jgi:hypothetical protein
VTGEAREELVREKLRRPLQERAGLTALVACGAFALGCGDRPPADPDARPRLRGELAAALAAAPGDATLIAGLVIAEVRATPSLAPALAALARAVDEVVAPGCPIDWARTADWALLAVGARRAVIASGGWSRGDVERCLGPVIWRDERTFVVGDGDGNAGAAGAVARAAAGLDRVATVWLAAEQRHLGGGPAAITTGRGELAGGLLLASALIEPANGAEADAVEAGARGAVARVQTTPGAALLGTIQVTRRGPAVELRATLGPAATSAALGALASPGGLVR